jgi:hypothetical protein
MGRLGEVARKPRVGRNGFAEALRVCVVVADRSSVDIEVRALQVGDAWEFLQRCTL